MQEVGPASIRPPIQGLCVGDLCRNGTENAVEPTAVGSALEEGYS